MNISNSAYGDPDPQDCFMNISNSAYGDPDPQDCF